MRSIGAVRVLATAPDTPPNRKSVANFEASGMADYKEMITKLGLTREGLGGDFDFN